MFKRSRQKNLSIFIISQDFNEIPKRTIRANDNTYHIFKRNNFVDDQNLYPDKASLDMTLDELKYLTSTCWNEKYQPLTSDITKDKYTSLYRLGLNSLFIPNSYSFQINISYSYPSINSTLKMSIYSQWTRFKSIYKKQQIKKTKELSKLKTES